MVMLVNDDVGRWWCSMMMINELLCDDASRLEIDWIRTHLLDGLIENNINNTSAWPSWLSSIRKYPHSFKYDRSYSVDRQHSTLRDLILRASLVDAYQWCTKHFGTDSK